MRCLTLKSRFSTSFRFVACTVLVTFTFMLPVPVAIGQGLVLPMPGVRVALSSGFTPPLIKGITIHPENPLQFDFLMAQGDEAITDQNKTLEYERLIKYFLAALTIPEKDLWVNLSPYEDNRVISDAFGKTEMGRDLLAQDYLLKQITASLIYPEEELGKTFWDKVHKEAQDRFGTTDIPVNTFNKVWIVPDDAVIYEHGTSAFVIYSHLKVMLEQDYLSLEKNSANEELGTTELKKEDVKDVSSVSSKIVREIVIPALEKEVNEGRNFAPLRQVFQSVVLAAWYKKTLKESLLGRVYVDQGKVTGIDENDAAANERIYNQYVEAFKTGVFNYIKEDVDPQTQEIIPRKYVSGGVATVLDGVRLEQRLTTVSSVSEVPERATPGLTELQQNPPMDNAVVRLGEAGTENTSARSVPFTEIQTDSPQNFWSVVEQTPALQEPKQMPWRIPGQPPTLRRTSWKDFVVGLLNQDGVYQLLTAEQVARLNEMGTWDESNLNVIWNRPDADSRPETLDYTPAQLIEALSDPKTAASNWRFFISSVFSTYILATSPEQIQVGETNMLKSLAVLKNWSQASDVAMLSETLKPNEGGVDIRPRVAGDARFVLGGQKELVVRHSEFGRNPVLKPFKLWGDSLFMAPLDTQDFTGVTLGEAPNSIEVANGFEQSIQVSYINRAGQTVERSIDPASVRERTILTDVGDGIIRLSMDRTVAYGVLNLKQNQNVIVLDKKGRDLYLTEELNIPAGLLVRVGGFNNDPTSGFMIANVETNMRAEYYGAQTSPTIRMSYASDVAMLSNVTDVPTFIQMFDMFGVMQDADTQNAMGELANRTYETLIAKNANPAPLLTGQESKEDRDKKLMSNLAPFDAIKDQLEVFSMRNQRALMTELAQIPAGELTDARLNELQDRYKTRPMDILEELVAKIQDRGQTDVIDADLQELAKQANAAWASRQTPSRRGRPVFRPWSLLSPEEVEKDYIFLDQFLPEVLKVLKSSVEERYTLEQRQFLSGEIDALVAYAQEVAASQDRPLTAREANALKKSAQIVMEIFSAKKRKGVERPYFVHQVGVARKSLEKFRFDDVITGLINLLHHDDREDVPDTFYAFRNYIRMKIGLETNADARRAREIQVNGLLLAVRLLSKLEGEEFAGRSEDELLVEYFKRLADPRTYYTPFESAVWYTDSLIHDTQLTKLSDILYNMSDVGGLFADGRLLTLQDEELEKAKGFPAKTYGKFFVAIDNFVGPSVFLSGQEKKAFFDDAEATMRGYIEKFEQEGEAYAPLVQASRDAIERLTQYREKMDFTSERKNDTARLPDAQKRVIKILFADTPGA